MYDIRCQALSRARGIALQARDAADLHRPLCGVKVGDVLDHPDCGLFLAVTHVLPDGIFAQGVQQAEPWGTVRDIRMLATTLRIRLQHGWLSKVPALRT